MEFKPHAYQAHCIEKILEINKIGLFLDMGLGKTVTTLTAVKELKYNRFLVRKVLVIAPKKVAEGTWTKEKDKWEHTKMLRVSQVLGSQIFLLDGGERLGRRYTQFRERYFDPGDRGQNVIYNYKAKPGTEESILEKISDICISMKAEDYLQLPDIIYHQIPVTLDVKAEKAYRELERKMVLALPEDEEEISVTSAAALSNKLLQLSNGAIYDEDHEVHEIHGCKIEAFLELIESLNGKSVLVFYNFQHDRVRILKALEKLKLRVRELRTTEDEDAWNQHEVDVLLTHPASSAYGLNLQQGGNHVIWFGLTWNYELYTQANKRLHRQGQEEKVIIHHLVCSGTRDEDVMLALEKKEDVQNWVMESLKARIRKIRQEGIM